MRICILVLALQRSLDSLQNFGIGPVIDLLGADLRNFPDVIYNRRGLKRATQHVGHLLTVRGNDFRNDRLKVISQLFIPAPEIPPGGRFGPDFREDAVPLALENLSKCIADCLNFFVRRCDCQLITFGFVLDQKILYGSFCGILPHVRILRASLSALNHIQRHDQLIPAGHRWQIHIRAGFVPGHPGAADGRLQNAGAFLETAFQLFCQIEFHIGLRIRSDHRQQERVYPLLNHLQIRPQAFRIQRPGIVFAGGVGLRIRMPNQRRVDPIRSCHRLPAQLDRFGPLLFSETGREWFDLHPILHQRERSGIAATRSPCLAECSHPFLSRLVIPFLDVFRSDDLRV